MDGEFLVKVDIAGQKLPMWIARKDEGFVRAAARRVSSKYDRYTQRYGKDASEIERLAMTSYTLSKELCLAEDRNDTAPYEEMIRKLTGVIEQYIEEYNPE